VTTALVRAGVVVLFGLTAAICMGFDVAQYRSLKDVGKLILISHIAYCLIFLGTAAPYSIAMVRVLFAPGAPNGLLQPYIQRCIFYPLAFQLAMYVFEVRLLHIMIETSLHVYCVAYTYKYTSRPVELADTCADLFSYRSLTKHGACLILLTCTCILSTCEVPIVSYKTCAEA